MKNDALEFNTLTLENAPTLRHFLCGDSERTCDFTFGGVVMWRRHFETCFAIADDTLILKNVYDGRVSFSMPVGKNPQGAVQLIREYCRENGVDAILNTVTETDCKTLENAFEIERKDERDLYDYLYSAESLSSFSGKKFNGQRNHINNFLANYPDFTVVEITDDNIRGLESFMCEYEKSTDKSSPVFRDELNMVREVLSQNSLYAQEGVFIEAGGKTVAFAMGEVVGDTLYVHIEKALSHVRGAYQMIVREFVRKLASKYDFTYVNREDDVGDEGLRRSKLSYHPLKLVQKYTVWVKGRF